MAQQRRALALREDPGSTALHFPGMPSPAAVNTGHIWSGVFTDKRVIHLKSLKNLILEPPPALPQMLRLSQANSEGAVSAEVLTLSQGLPIMAIVHAFSHC